MGLSINEIQKLSVIIPAFNEEKTILEILKKVSNVELSGKISKEVLVINDCSSDRTGRIVEDFLIANPNLDIKYFKHESNQGKGAAIQTGISHATGDYLVIQDADLEYDPDEYNNLLEPVIKVSADVVYGSRFVGGKPHRILFFWHRIGNMFLTSVSNLFTNLNLTDMETCYKLFKTDLIKSIELKEKRFGFEPEVTARISKIRDIKIYEVGISYYGRTYKEGKKINWKDGFRALYIIIKYNLWPK
jgi:glycosyltransferase involved in cell wall biosynthesis